MAGDSISLSAKHLVDKSFFHARAALELFGLDVASFSSQASASPTPPSPAWTRINDFIHEEVEVPRSVSLFLPDVVYSI